MRNSKCHHREPTYSCVSGKAKWKSLYCGRTLRAGGGCYLHSVYLLLHFVSNLLTADNFEQSCQVDWVPQIALMLRNPSASAGDIKDTSSIPGWEDLLEGRGNTLACGGHMDRGQAKVWCCKVGHRVLEQQHTPTSNGLKQFHNVTESVAGFVFTVGFVSDSST